MDAFISLDFEAVPNHFDNFVRSDAMLCKFKLIELKLEIERIELLPINHATYSS